MIGNAIVPQVAARFIEAFDAVTGNGWDMTHQEKEIDE